MMVNCVFGVPVGRWILPGWTAFPGFFPLVAETPRRPQTSRFNPLLESKAHRKPHDAAENEYVAAEASPYHQRARRRVDWW